MAEIQDFTFKQTEMPPDKYISKTLVGNWFEDRCDPHSKNSKFYSQLKFNENNYDNFHLTKEKFHTCSDDWMHFQKRNPQDHFTSMSMQEYKDPKEQHRTSVLNPSLTKPGFYSKNEKQLKEYQDRWTHSKDTNVYERTYLGADNHNQTND